MTGKPREIKFVANPLSKAPDKGKPYLAVQGPDGKEEWFELSSDGEDTTEADFDFDRGKKWAAAQKKDGGK